MTLLEGRERLTLAEATGALLAQWASSERRLVLVTGRSPGLGDAFAGAAPERWVVAPGRRGRLAVGAGLALAGWSTVVLGEDPTDARGAPWHLAGPLVAVTSAPAVAQAAWEAGVRVLAPAWAVDVGPLLLSGIGQGPACVLLHADELPPSPPLALDPPTLAGPRTITHGAAGRAAAAGPLMPALLEAAWRLARAGRAITAQQLTCLGPEGPSPRAAASSVFWDAGAGWEPVPVAAGDFRGIEDAMLARLES